MLVGALVVLVGALVVLVGALVIHDSLGGAEMAILKAVGFLGILGLLSFAEAGWLPGSVGGGQAGVTYCDIDDTHGYNNPCTGGPACNFSLTHYDWSWFSSENAVRTASYYCAGFENGAGGLCSGSARSDEFSKNCTANW